MIRFIQRRKALKAKYEAFFDDPENTALTQQEKQWISEEFDRRVRRGNARIIISGKIDMLVRNITVKPINLFKKPMPVVWHSEHVEDTKYPFCPVCDEFAYNKTHCIFCGRRFIWNDGN